MTWEEVKEVLNRYDIRFGYNNILYKDIPFTKKYFERRPPYAVYTYEGTKNKQGKIGVVKDIYGERYCIQYNQPCQFDSTSISTISTILDQSMTRIFGLSTAKKRIVITTKEQLEWSINDLKEQLEKYHKLNNNKDLQQLYKEYKNEVAKLEQINNNIKTIKNRYINMFKIQSDIISDF